MTKNVGTCCRRGGWQSEHQTRLINEKQSESLHWIVELVRFQNSSVSVLNFKQDSVSVLIGSSKCLTFGFTVLTVLTFFT